MTSGELRDLDHDWVKSELASTLEDFIKKEYQSEDDISIETEETIEIPYRRKRTRDADILVSFEDSESFSGDCWQSWLRGCAFEIKPRSEAPWRGAGQLHHYSKAGYQPIIVAPGWLLVKRRGQAPSYEWLLQEVVDHGCALEIVSEKPLRFTQSAGYNTNPALNGLRDHLLQTHIRSEPDDTEA